MVSRLLLFTFPLLLPALAAAQAPLIVSPGHGIDPSRLTFRTDTVRVLISKNGVETPGPLQIESISRAEREGRPAIMHRIRVESAQMTLDDTTWYDPITYAPIAHRSHGRRTVALDYVGLRVAGSVATGDQAPRLVDVILTAPAFDPSALNAVLGSIAWRPGLSVEIAMFNHEQLGILPTKVTALGMETLATDSGPTAAWHLAVQRQGRTVDYWLNARTGVDMKVMADLGNGVSMRSSKGGAR